MLAQSPSSFSDSGAPDDWELNDSLFEVFGEHLLVGSVDDEASSVVDLKMSDTEDEEFERYLSQDRIPRLTMCKTPSSPLQVKLKCSAKKSREHTPELDMPVLNAEPEGHESSGTTEKLCMNRNAIQARENRQRKKQYVNDLESKLKKMSDENAVLTNNCQQQQRSIQQMATEISYLKSVIANQTGLSALLKNIHKTSGLVFNSPLDNDLKDTSTNKKRPLESSMNDNDENVDINEGSSNIKKFSGRCVKKPKVEQDPTKVSVVLERLPKTPVEESGVSGGPLTPCSSPEPVTSGGVCLHVASNKVSLEFCSSCATSAAESWKVSAKKSTPRTRKRERTR